MVKRHSKTGRRQILQLEDKKPPPTNVATSSKFQVPKSLIQYSDSDDDCKSSKGEPENSHPPESTASGPIDLQVADFLKEIDALTVIEKVESKPASFVADAESEEIEEPSCSDSNTELKKAEKIPLDAAADEINGSSTNSAEGTEEVYCMWQQCHDETSGYSYYWNVMTNEVTWECPPEYVAYQNYISSMASNSNVHSTHNSGPEKSNTTSKIHAKKPEVLVKEGAIIPISYFGESSSSESSDEDTSSCLPLQPKFPPQSSNTHSSKLNKVSHKSKTAKKEAPEAMGPQLPPDFQFPADVPLSPFQSSSGSAKSSVAIGPKLPPGYDVSVEVTNTDVNVSENQLDKQLGKDSLNITCAELPSISEEQQNNAISDQDKPFQPQNNDSDIVSEVADAKEALDTALKHEPPVCKSNEDAVSSIGGSWSVVGYDSFTDTEDEDEMDVASLNSPSKCASPVNVCSVAVDKESQQNSPDHIESCVDDTEYSSNLNEVSSKQEEISTVDSTSGTNCEVPANQSPAHHIPSYDSDTSDNESSLEECPPTRSYNDIVGHMFSIAKDTGGKFGFGFSKSKKLEIENKKYSSSDTRQKSHLHYPMINFVKSKKVLNLNALNEIQSSYPKHIFDVENKAPDKTDKPQDLSDVVEMHSSEDRREPLVPQDNQVTVETSSNGPDPIADITPIVKKEKEAISLMNKEESKKCKVKKKDYIAPKKEKKEDENSLQDVRKTQTTMDEDDIDQLLGNILKEMGKSAEPQKAGDTISSKGRVQEGKKRFCTERAASPVKRRKKEEPKEQKKKDEVLPNIIDLSTVLMEKISFLVANHSTLVSLSSVLVQIQTRLMDWQAGALESKYFMDRLEEVQQYLQHYEIGAVTGDWTCQWDRESKRYFYVNEQTRQSQWNFPSETQPPGMQAKSLWVNPVSDVMSVNTGYVAAGSQFPLAPSSVCKERKNSSAASALFPICKETGSQELCDRKSSWMHQITNEPSPPPPPPGVDSPPPPPPMTPPPQSPPPPPPESTGKGGGIPDVDMDLEDSNSSDSALFSRIARGTTDGEQPLKSFYMDATSARSPDHQSNIYSVGSASSTSVKHSEAIVIRKPPQPVMMTSNSTIFPGSSASNIQSTWTTTTPLPSSSSSSAQESGEVTASPIVINSNSVTSDGNKTVLANDNSRLNSSSTSSSKVTVPTSSNVQTIPKKEKKKTKLHTGLAFKKKNIPSLVEKWQKIKEEQEKEDKHSEDQKLLTSMK